MKLLIIEDDQYLSDSICETTKEMFETEQASDFEGIDKKPPPPARSDRWGRFIYNMFH